MSLIGLEGYLVNIEIDVSAGIPCWDIVGLPDASVKEAKERVRTAIKNSGYDMQSRKIVVNLSPADIKKEGSFFDLPIAIGILLDFEDIKLQNLEDTVFIGELSLNGKLNKVNGILPMCIEAKKLGIKRVILPEENAKEASIVAGLKVIGASYLVDVVEYLNGGIDLQPTQNDIGGLFNKRQKYSLNFSDVKGQENVKRALEVAAAGGHNLILVGAPGCGKSMMAKRLPSILPPLSLGESLETTKIHSVAGKLGRNASLISQRPFRDPHHTISQTAMVGGGSFPQPGEISLAHNGVLFLDELPEFQRGVLEVLRQPLEDRRITISRVKCSIDYPASFTLIASMNPCPCGYFGHPTKPCICSRKAVNQYLSRVSGPLLDSLDIHIEVQPVKFDELSSNEKSESSATIRARVNHQRKLQRQDK